MRRLMVTVAVVALLIVIVPHVIRELRRRYIIGSPRRARDLRASVDQTEASKMHSREVVKTGDVCRNLSTPLSVTCLAWKRA